jgi:hypothetical protein
MLPPLLLRRLLTELLLLYILYTLPALLLP